MTKALCKSVKNNNTKKLYERKKDTKIFIEV